AGPAGTVRGYLAPLSLCLAPGSWPGRGTAAVRLSARPGDPAGIRRRAREESRRRAIHAGLLPGGQPGRPAGRAGRRTLRGDAGAGGRATTRGPRIRALWPTPRGTRSAVVHAAAGRPGGDFHRTAGSAWRAGVQ